MWSLKAMPAASSAARWPMMPLLLPALSIRQIALILIYFGMRSIKLNRLKQILHLFVFLSIYGIVKFVKEKIVILLLT